MIFSGELAVSNGVHRDAIVPHGSDFSTASVLNRVGLSSAMRVRLVGIASAAILLKPGSAITRPDPPSTLDGAPNSVPGLESDPPRHTVPAISSGPCTLQFLGRHDQTRIRAAIHGCRYSEEGRQVLPL